MLRRTFLKAVFAAAVAPASCVKALYSPKESAWREYYREYDNRIDRLREIIKELLIELESTEFQPPIRR